MDSRPNKQPDNHTDQENARYLDAAWNAVVKAGLTAEALEAGVVKDALRLCDEAIEIIELAEIKDTENLHVARQWMMDVACMKNKIGRASAMGEEE